jgi:hypothetical protein
VARNRSLTGEAMASFALAWLAILVWHGLLPWFGWIERVVLRPGPWGELFGLLFISGSYYVMLCVILFFADRMNALVHPISTAYFGGWWLIVLLAALSVLSPSFNSILGLSVTGSGANLVFITLFVGAAKYWVDGYLHPPPTVSKAEQDQQREDSNDRPA